ncbi:hypothetical protein NKJ28_06450 [Mesorhizobium sp. M0145]|uniref:hypothetical protein n=1 Tax=unclassified Mesorhizobium TaxID=325217 RepID=UPI003338EDC6
MPGGEANAIFYLVDRAGLEGATATSGVLACDVCFQDAEKLISTAEIGREAVIHDLQVLTQDGLSPVVSGKGAVVERVSAAYFRSPSMCNLGSR